MAVALAASAGAAPASAGSALTASALAPSKSAPSRSGPSALTPAQVRAQEWWIVSLNLHRAWSISKGLGVTVALLDSGVDAGFGDLRGAVRPGFIPGGRGDARSDTDPEIHGTRLADEIAGRGTGFGLLGIAPRASVLPVVIPDHDFARPTAAALNRLATLEHPPDVVNMSYGSPRACPGDVQAAVLHAVRAGIIVVAAAGNSGASTNAAAYPADCAGVVAVGAVDVHGRAWSDTERQPYVALAAPGVHMISADPQAASGYGYADGTSDAAAIVSGIFALVRARFPRLSARGIVTRVLATAHQFAGRQGSRNDRLGFGVALPYNALTAKVPASAPNPVYDAVTAGENPVAHTAAPSGASAAGSATPPGPPRTAAAGADPSGGSTGVLVGGLVAAVVIVGLVLTLLLRGRPRS
ncbi:MAG TPA: S8 family serine peptidase [Jatrophihabitans sp.]|nr:S8 family serine peptidase [Jatrophihabitans sp.]